MLHLIPNNRYTDLCTKAVESILKTYDLGHETKDFTLCDRWDLDKLIDAQTTVPGVIKNVGPSQLWDYLVEAEIGMLDDTYYWQTLPTDAWEADRVVAELEPLLAKNIKVQFLMPMTVSEQQWYSMLATGMTTKTMQTIYQYGTRLDVLEPLEMSTLVYTLPDRSKHQSLMVAFTRLTPKTRSTVKEIIRVFIEPLDAILAQYRKLPDLF
jgi:hypothetical protein